MSGRPALPRPRVAGIALALALGLAVPGTADAQHREGGASKSALGKADAVRASGFSNEALYFNPAGMAQIQLYSIEAGYTYVNEVGGHVADVSIVDSVTNQFLAAGLGYTYIDSDQVPGFDVGGANTRIGHQLRAALASGYRSQQLSIFLGAGLRWLNLTLDDRDSVDPVTMDVGALLVVGNLFRVGVVGHNVIEHPDERNELPRQLGVGASFYTSSFLAEFDTVIDFDTALEARAKYSLGLEYDIAQMVPVRAGYQFDQVSERHRITVGLGYHSNIVAVDVGFMQDVSSEVKTDFIVGSNIRVFLP